MHLYLKNMDIIIIDETAAEHQVAPSPCCGFAWAVAILGLNELDLQADEGLNASTTYIPGSLKPRYACMHAVMLTPGTHLLACEEVCQGFNDKRKILVYECSAHHVIDIVEP